MVNYDSVIVLGNGFDMSLGLKTGYNHFYQSDQFAYAKDKATSIFGEVETIFQVIEKEHIELSNWVDLERLFKIRYSMEGGNCKLTISQIKEEYQLVYSALKRFLSRELESMGKVLSDRNFILNHPIYYSLDRQNFKSALIVNFSYTQIPQKIFNILPRPACPKIDYWDIHGTLSNGNIILGVDDGFKLHSKEFSFLRKSFSPEFRGHFVRQKLNSAKEVVFFGHSLGETDHFYFKDLFLSNSEEMKQSITVYHYNAEDFENHYFQITTMNNNMSGLYIDHQRLYRM